MLMITCLACDYLVFCFLTDSFDINEKEKTRSMLKKKPKHLPRRVLLKIPPLLPPPDSPRPNTLVAPPDKPHVCTALRGQRALVLRSSPGAREGQKLGAAQK